MMMQRTDTNIPACRIWNRLLTHEKTPPTHFVCLRVYFLVLMKTKRSTAVFGGVKRAERRRPRRGRQAGKEDQGGNEMMDWIIPMVFFGFVGLTLVVMVRKD